MSSYLMTNYKGKYSLQAEIDKRTGDFCRDKNNNLDNFTDIWIDCQSKGRIYHYGKNVLEFYVNSLGRGHNILKAIYDDFIGSSDKFVSITISKDKDGNDKENKTFDYGAMYEELIAKNIIVDKVEETDEEILFKFKANMFEKLEPILKPRTYCADRSPFSTKNLRRNAIKTNGKYVIDNEELARYKEITSVIPKGEMRIYIDVNNAFIAEISMKNHKPDAIKNEIKVGGYSKTYEYFHSLGTETWNRYLEFLQNKIKEKYN